MIRSFRKFILLLLFFVPLLGFSQAQKRPNIIFIFSDDHAYQAIGAYGNKIAKTPNIDRLAREGALFKKLPGYQLHLRAEPGYAADGQV